MDVNLRWGELHRKEARFVPFAYGAWCAALLLTTTVRGGFFIGVAVFASVLVLARRCSCPVCGKNFMAKAGRFNPGNPKPPRLCGSCGHPRLDDPTLAWEDAARVGRMQGRQALACSMIAIPFALLVACAISGRH